MKLSKLKNRWNSVSEEGFPIFSKGWFIVVLWIIGAMLFFIVFVLITGDKFEQIFGLLIFGGFWFIMGTLFGIHRAETMERESKKQQQIEEEYKRTHSD